MILMETSMGDIKIELLEEEAPISSANFKKYVEEGFYDGTIFHRVIPGFMIQGGGMNEDMESKATNEPIKNEADNGIKNDRATLSMARTAEVDSATSQFFLNVADNAFLNNGERDFGYAVFAKVVEGMEVADEIVGAETTNVGFHENVPCEPIFIKTAKVIEG